MALGPNSNQHLRMCLLTLSTGISQYNWSSGLYAFLSQSLND